MPTINRIQDPVTTHEPDGSHLSSETCRRAVAEYPVTSILTAFGVGIGAGVVLGTLLSGPEPASQSAAAAIGRRVLDSIGDYLPVSLRS